MLLDSSDHLIALAESAFFTRPLSDWQSRLTRYAARADLVFQLGEELIAEVIARHTDPVECFDELIAHFLDRHGLTKDGWIEKSPRNCERYSELSELHPQFYFVSMIRDGREIVTSRIQGRAHYHCTLERYAEAMNHVFSFKSPRHIILRYEDLVANPEEQLRNLFTFLDEEFNPAILKRYANPTPTRDPMLMNQAMVFRPITKYDDRRWLLEEHRERLEEFHLNEAAVHFNRLAGYGD